MTNYLIRRLLLMLPTLLLVLGITFVVLRALPGDAVTLALAESGRVDEQQRAEYEKQYGLDRPIPVQFGLYLGDLLQGDLGRSIWSGKSVMDGIKSRLPVTVELGLLSLVIGIVLGLPLGAISASRQGSLVDYGARFLAISGVALPQFVIGTVAIVYGGIWFGWSPTTGSMAGIFSDPTANAVQFLVPALVVGWSLAGPLARMTRSSLLEVLRQDYIRTAVAKGLSGRQVLVRHALRNSFTSVLSIIGTQVGFLLGGVLIIEVVFAMPGLGRLTYDSISQRDYAQVQGNVLVFGFMMVFVNLLIDISYGIMDPRVKYA